MGGQWEHLCIQLTGDSEIPHRYDCTFDFSQVLSQGGKNVVVLPARKEEKKTLGTDTQRGVTLRDQREKSGEVDRLRSGG